MPHDCGLNLNTLHTLEDSPDYTNPGVGVNLAIRPNLADNPAYRKSTRYVFNRSQEHFAYSRCLDFQDTLERRLVR